MTNLDNLLARLQNVKQSGDGYVACCPAHDDQKPSLSVGIGDEGKILLKCHVGCSFDEIVKPLDLKPADYMGWENIPPHNRCEQSNGLDFTLEEFSLSKRLPLDRFFAKSGCLRVQI